MLDYCLDLVCPKFLLAFRIVQSIPWFNWLFLKYVKYEIAFHSFLASSLTSKFY